MKRFNVLKGLLFLLIIVLSVPLTILEEICKGFSRLIKKVKLNYQLMMYARQLTR